LKVLLEGSRDVEVTSERCNGVAVVAKIGVGANARMRAAAAAGSLARSLSGAPVCPVDSRPRANVLTQPELP
jgi:hypothetical protein